MVTALQRLPGSGDTCDLTDAGVVDQLLDRGQDPDGTLLQASMTLVVEVFRGMAGDVPLPVETVEDDKGL